MIRRHARRSPRPLLLLPLLLLTELAAAPRAAALPATDSFYVTVDTSGLIGVSGGVAFDLINGDSGIANNGVLVKGFSTDGSLIGSTNANTGGAIGDLPGSVLIGDVDFFNETARAITLGSTQKFTVRCSRSFLGPGAPDELSFFLLDSTGASSLITTTDPTGANALFVICMDGSRGGKVFIYDSLTPGVSAQVHFDDTPPVTTSAVTGPAGLHGWYTGATEVTLSAADPDVDGSVAGTFYTVDSGETQTYAGPFTVSGNAVHTVTFWSVDAADNVEGHHALEIKIDGEPPVITCPPNVTTGTDAGQCYATMNPGTATATDNLSAATIGGIRSDGQPLNAAYQLGTTTITWTATDDAGNSSTCDQTIEVKDLEAPIISGASADRSSLWPPNHKMVLVTLSYSVTDNCDTAPVASLSAVSSQAGNGAGSGNTPTDIVVVDNRHIYLRSERAGNGGDRVYTLTIRATDKYGNSSTKTLTVTVPHNQ